MQVPSPRWRGRLLLPAVTAVVVVAGPAVTQAMAAPGAVYSQTNDPAGNVVQKFDRAADGKLTAAGSFSTGGTGLADLGGRQGAVELSDDGSSLYAVNAGSDSLTAFRATKTGLKLIGSVPSGGAAPVSVDRHGGRVYVLNSGGTPNVTGFSVLRDGSLRRIVGGSRDLPGALGTAQVSVAPDGRALVVSERLSNRLETLPLDKVGRPGAPVITPSSGTVPFGFAFGKRDAVIVSEAGLSTVSSYRLPGIGALTPVTISLPVGQGAACWVAVSPDGRFAYTGNASGSIGAFAVSRSGALTAIGTTLLASPRDLDFAARNARYMYAVSPGTAGGPGQVTGYRVGRDGSLTEITSVPAAPGLTGAAAA